VVAEIYDVGAAADFDGNCECLSYIICQKISSEEWKRRPYDAAGEKEE